MFKVYDNKLLDRLESVMLGIRTGGVNCNGPKCAGDTTVVTEERGPLKTLLSISRRLQRLRAAPSPTVEKCCADYTPT